MKRLKLSYTLQVEYRVAVNDDDAYSMGRAIEDAMAHSGITNGSQRGIDPESIRFTWEDDS